MTYSSRRSEAHRRPVTIVEIDADLCPLTYGADPCAATFGQLLTQSEALDNAAWTKTACSVTADATTDPGGGTGADLIVEDATASNHYVHQAFAASDNAAYVASCYAKAGTRSWLRIRIQDKTGAGPRAWFNLSTGAVGTVDSGYTASIESVGSGWYRCALICDDIGTGSAATEAQYFMQTADAETSYTGDGSSGLYVWGAQVHAGTKLGPYTASTTYTVSATGSDRCYNAYATCQDKTNFAGRLRGSAAAATSTTITLDSDAHAVADVYVGATIEMTSGDGRGQVRTITAYTSGRVATVDSAWTTTPAAGDEYIVINAKTHKHITRMHPLPEDVQAISDLAEITITPTRIQPGKGLSTRAEMRAKFRDAPHHDRGIDPYVTTRSYTPESLGTYWGKFIARNRYIQGRAVRVKHGYLTHQQIPDPTPGYLTGQTLIPQPAISQLSGYYAVAVARSGHAAAFYQVYGSSTYIMAFLRHDGSSWVLDGSVATLQRKSSARISDDGDLVVVGGYFDLQVFTRSGTTWSSLQTINSSTYFGAYVNFGSSIGLSADSTRLLVGAPEHDGSAGADSGAVEAFSRTTGSYSKDQRIEPSVLAAGDFFGTDCDMDSSGTTAVVALAAGKGRAFVLTYSSGTGWSESAQITLSGLGGVCAISGDGQRIALWRQSDGYIYVYQLSGGSWVQEDSFNWPGWTLADSTVRSMQFDDDGEYLIVGNAANPDVVRLFRRVGSSWSQVDSATWPRANYDFGYRVSISSDAAYAIASYKRNYAYSDTAVSVLWVLDLPVEVACRGYQTTLDSADTETREYVVDTVAPATRDGSATLRALDVLTLADDKHAMVPVASEGKLSADITSADSSLTLESGDGAAYPSSGYAAIDKEVVQYTRSGDLITLVARGQWGTAVDDHSAGAVFQECYSYSGNVVDVVKDLIYSYTNVPPRFIDEAEWDAERDTWMSLHTVRIREVKPRAVTKILGELCEQLGFDIYWHDVDQLLKLRALQPPTGVTKILSDDGEILQGSLTVTRDPSRQITRVAYYYDLQDPFGGSDEEDYAAPLIVSDGDVEAVGAQDGEILRVIKARHVASSAVANAVASRLVARFGHPPIMAKLRVAPKDSDVWTADEVLLDTRAIVDETGASKQTNMQIISARHDAARDEIEFELLSSAFDTSAGAGPAAMYGYVVSTGLETTEYSSATTAQQEAQPGAGWIAPDSGSFSDGRPAYKII